MALKGNARAGASPQSVPETDRGGVSRLVVDAARHAAERGCDFPALPCHEGLLGEAPMLGSAGIGGISVHALFVAGVFRPLPLR